MSEVKYEPSPNIPTKFDFGSLYPDVMKLSYKSGLDYSSYIKSKERKEKIDNFLKEDNERRDE